MLKADWEGIITEVIGVRFKKVGKVYDFDPVNLKVDEGSYVIVETARGVEFGQVAQANHEVAEEEIVKPLRRVLRAATQEDRQTAEEHAELEKQAFGVCEQKIRAHGLEMKLVSVEYTFDRGKILFYFTADGRIDFRELVKDLASVFRTRIELRQIGVRDEAKMLGGLGICGCPLCCATFLDDFAPVSINMAKDQGLSLNPAKISGSCGRLMCCLKYENEAYQDLLRNTPSVDSLVETPQGRGVVTEVGLLRGLCKVRLEQSSEAPKTFSRDELTVLRPGRGRGRRSGKKAEIPEEPAEKPAQAPQAPRPEDGAHPEPEPRLEPAPRAGRAETRPPRPPRQAEPEAQAEQQDKPSRPPRQNNRRPGGRRPNKQGRGKGKPEKEG